MTLHETLKKYNPFRNYVSLSHWFTYHWRAVVWIVLLLLAGLWFSLLPKEPDADYVISWVGTQLLSPKQEQALTEQLQAAGTDVNGDGVIVVHIDQYAISFGDEADGDTLTESYTYLAKLLNAIQVKDCRLYLLEDPEGFQRVTGVLQYLDGTIPPEENSYECANWAEMCVPLETDAVKVPVYLGRRCLFDGEDPEQLFPGADALFDALTQA